MEKDEDCTSKWVEEGHYSSLDCPEFDQYQCDYLDFVKKETHLAKRLTRVKDDKGCEITLRKHIKTWRKPKEEEAETTKTVIDQGDDQIKTKPIPKATKKTNGTKIEPQILAKRDKENPYKTTQQPTISSKDYKKISQKNQEEVFPPAQYIIREKLKKSPEYDPGKKRPADDDHFELHHIPPQISTEDQLKYSSRKRDVSPTKAIIKSDKNDQEYMASNGTKKTAIPTSKGADVYPFRTSVDPFNSVNRPQKNVTVRRRNETAVEDSGKKLTSRPVQTPRKKEHPVVDDDFNIHPTAWGKKDHQAEYLSQKRDLRATKPTIKVDKNGQYTVETPEEAGYSRVVQKDIISSYDHPPQTTVEVNGHSAPSRVDREEPAVDDGFQVDLKSNHPSVKNDFKTHLRKTETIYNGQLDNGHLRNGQIYKSSVTPSITPPLDVTYNMDPEVKIEVKTPVTNADNDESKQGQYKELDDNKFKNDLKYYPVPLPEINQELLVPVYDTNKSDNGQSKDDSSNSSSDSGQSVPGVKRALAKALAKEVTGTSDSTHSFPGVKRALGKALVKEMTGGTKRSLINGAQYAVQLQPWCKTGKTVKLHDEAMPAFPVEVTEKYLATASLRPIEVVSLDEETNPNVVRENDTYPRKEFTVKLNDLHPLIKEEAETKSDINNYYGLKLRPVQPEPRHQFPVNQKQDFGMNLRPAKPPVTTVKPVYLVEDETGSRVYDMVDDKPNDAGSRFRRAGTRLRNAFQALRRDDTSAHPPGWEDNRVFVPTDIALPAKQPAWRAVKPASHFGPEIRWVQKN